jgi:hypothetical protein
VMRVWSARSYSTIAGKHRCCQAPGSAHAHFFPSTGLLVPGAADEDVKKKHSPHHFEVPALQGASWVLYAYIRLLDITFSQTSQ